MTNLGSFGGTCTFAEALNNQGQVTGGSTFEGDHKQHPFLWDYASKSFNDLGTFGGRQGDGIDINENGVVVGWATYRGDRIVHAALWSTAGITDLETVDGDLCSVAFSVNLAGQVVGISVPATKNGACDFSQSRAFLWEASSIVDLNSLIPSDSPLYLTSPETIKDSGEIAGIGFDKSNGYQHAFLLIPCSTTCQGTSAAVPFRPAPAISKPHNDQTHPMLRGRSGPVHRLLGVSPLGTPPSHGMSLPPGPNATLSPTSMIFECRNVINEGCQCITSRTATLSNTGTSNLNIAKITITGPFSEGNSCGTNLGAGKSCSISVHWSEKNGSGGYLSVFDDAGGSPQQVGLSGIKFCTPW